MLKSFLAALGFLLTCAAAQLAALQIGRWIFGRSETAALKTPCLQWAFGFSALVVFLGVVFGG